MICLQVGTITFCIIKYILWPVVKLPNAFLKILLHIIYYVHIQSMNILQTKHKNYISLLYILSRYVVGNLMTPNYCVKEWNYTIRYHRIQWTNTSCVCLLQHNMHNMCYDYDIVWNDVWYTKLLWNILRFRQPLMLKLHSRYLLTFAITSIL